VKHPLLHIVLITAIYSSVYAGPAGQPPLAAAETLLVKQDYAAARSIAAGYLPGGPEENYALYLRVAIEQTELLDYESYHFRGERFLEIADSIRKVLEVRLPGLRGKDSTRCLFYIANIYGGMGVIKAKMGKWFSAIKSSLTSIGLLKEAVQRDSAMCAAFLGIGAFHYYLSKSFTWIPFIDENSGNRGVREIEQATTASSPFHFAAKNTLCWILIDQGQFDRADSVALTALEETPGSTIFQRIRCMIALWSGRYDRALQLAQKLSEVSLMRDPVNWSDYVMAYYVLAGSYEGLGKIKEARAAARHILETKLPSEFKKIPPVKKNLRRVLEIQKKCLQ
jgi:tetratricopeptide (TPR) repeat protein